MIGWVAMTDREHGKLLSLELPATDGRGIMRIWYVISLQLGECFSLAPVMNLTILILHIVY